MKKFNRKKQAAPASTYEQMRAIDRKLDGFGSKIRKALPYIMGGSAYTAWAVPAVIKYNCARDMYLNNAYMTCLQQAQSSAMEQMKENALQFRDLSDFTFFMQEYHDFYPNAQPEGIIELQNSNPELYNTLRNEFEYLVSYNPEFNTEFAQSRGFATWNEYVAFAKSSLDRYDLEGIVEYVYYSVDYDQAALTRVLKNHSDELLAQGIDVEQMLNTEIDLLPKTDQEASGMAAVNMLIDQAMTHLSPEPMTAAGLERYGVDPHSSANELLDQQSDSPLDLSTLQLEDAVEIGIAGALVAVGAGYITSKAMDFLDKYDKGGKGGQAIRRGASKISSSIRSALDSIKNMSARGANRLADVYNQVDQNMNQNMDQSQDQANDNQKSNDGSEMQR